MDQKLACSWPGSGISVRVHFCCWKDLKPQIVVWFPWKHIVDRLSLSKHSLPLVTRCAGKETLEALQVSSSGKQQLFHLYCGLLMELMWPIRSQDLKFVSPDWSVELKVDRNSFPSYMNQRILRQCSMSWQSVSPKLYYRLHGRYRSSFSESENSCHGNQSSTTYVYWWLPCFRIWPSLKLAVSNTAIALSDCN